jgi:nucleotide-binding universal stress UspA family protein
MQTAVSLPEGPIFVTRPDRVTPRHLPDAATPDRRQRLHPYSRAILAVRDPHGDAAALRVAAELAARADADVAAVTVLEPTVSIPSGLRREAHECEAADRPRLARLLHTVRRTLRDVRAAGARAWPLHYDIGEPASAIVRVAAEHGAELVIVGLGRSDPDDRAYGSHVAVRTSLIVDRPLLAVAANAVPPFRRAMLLLDGTGFDETLVTAARALLGDAELVPVGDTNVLGSVPLGVAHRLAAPLDVPADVSPMRAVLAAAARRATDLIVTRLHGRTPAVRVLCDGSARDLLTHADCSVLLVPS